MALHGGEDGIDPTFFWNGLLDGIVMNHVTEGLAPCFLHLCALQVFLHGGEDRINVVLLCRLLKSFYDEADVWYAKPLW